MKIIIGVDDSPHSRAAVEYVKRGMWPAGTQILVVSAVQPAYALVDVGVGSYVQEAHDVEMKSHQETAARAEKELKESGCRTSAKAIFGDPRVVLVETAALERADLIVIGSHGRTGLGKFLMGSVASHVVTHAPCNVLVVKRARM